MRVGNEILRNDQRIVLSIQAGFLLSFLSLALGGSLVLRDDVKPDLTMQLMAIITLICGSILNVVYEVLRIVFWTWMNKGEGDG